MHAQAKPEGRFSRVDLALILVAVLWGLNMPAMKYGMGHMPPLAFNWLRFLLSVPAAWVIILVPRGGIRPIARPDWGALLKVGFGFFVFVWFFTLGLSKTTAGNTAILMSLLPIAVVFWNRMLRVEAITAAMYLGIVISLAGALLIIYSSGKQVSLKSQYILGNVILLLGVLANGYFLAGSKPLTRKYPPTLVATYCFTIAFAFLTLVSLPSLGRVKGHGLAMVDYVCLFYCGPVALTLTNFLWVWGVSRIGSTRTSVYNNLPPIVAIAGGVAFLGERFGLATLTGAVIIFAGIYVCRTGTAGIGHKPA